MGTVTRYQAVRTAIQELGPQASHREIADYVQRHMGIELGDPRMLALYVSMVNSKMSRKPSKPKDLGRRAALAPHHPQFVVCRVGIAQWP